MDLKEATLEIIKEKAVDCNKQGKKWHFHILTPKCLLNDSGRFAFILENSSDNQHYVNYADEPAMALGKELVGMLHGEEIAEKKESYDNITPQVIQKILARAKELNAQNKNWHHHMLFPDCIYNEHKGQWCILFEDPETQEKIEYVDKDEPRDQLNKIETLYYAQKSLT